MYKVFQLYFGRESKSTLKQRQNFGRSISATESVLKRTFERKSFFPIQEYLDQEMKYRITTGFLEKFLEITSEYQDFFSRFQRGEFCISVPTPGYQFDKVIIRGSYLVDTEENRMIIPVYGTSDNPKEEFSIFYALCNHFSETAIQNSIETFDYWDLSKAEIQSSPIMELREISIDSLRPVFNRLAAS
ncbi:hypothetical protein [Bacillus rubiinfantis]|uniref:hypothetical protein n=1 Tax=Bacillus rubiinfantis TaxID=1499680 RepID=UPI0005A6A0B7|nr:hypothetical protein [Bacillus rubiinfantis]